jgi:carbon monoxide dehydrogenase subunit G
MAKEDSMASIRIETNINVNPEEAWAAIRDVGAIHRRLAAGFVVDTRLEADARIVTFANGLVVRELIIDVDDRARRLAYAAVGGQLTHHNASFQVFANGPGGSRVVWIADLLPNEAAARVAAMMKEGSEAMARTLEQVHAER